MTDDPTRTSSGQGPSSGWLSSSGSISHGRFAPGAMVAGRYRVIGLLGKGGMGEVYRADDLRLGQQVALKFLPEGFGADPARLAQFHNEVRMAREVSHPAVCRVHDIGEFEGHPYLSMEYVGGEDLATSLRRIGRFPEDKAVEIARQLCSGLAAAHQRGVIHRDLKPANVMLDEAGRVRIMDFGLAAIGQVGDVRAGTPAYMAPEQLSGQGVGPKSDIFALGLILYELFTGKRAFASRTVGELMVEHQGGVTTMPSTRVASLDQAIERAILRCLEVDPARRPASPMAVSAALPGGDPLAAALAAGETPSPEMVAAAGEGAGLSMRVASLLLAFVVLGVTAHMVLSVRASPLDLIRPDDAPEVLAERARDALKALGYEPRARDEAYAFEWRAQHLREPQTDVRKAITEQPSPIAFWYRRGPAPFTAGEFHNDLLTPGIVTQADPPLIMPGMAELLLDHEGRLLQFETIPDQRDAAPLASKPVDWAPLFSLAQLDPATLTPAEPLWHWLASADTRRAWTGVWPGTTRPLRVEAAALGGRPVAFALIGSWTTPWRMPDDNDSDSVMLLLAMLMTVAVLIPVGAAILARRNIRNGRGDRRGAGRLAVVTMVSLMGLWVCRVHVVASAGVIAMFLLAICTSVFYAALLWTIYMAVEPFVRRHWPKVLVSWTNAFSGRLSDPVVGRDLLIGAALGVWSTVTIRGLVSVFDPSIALVFPGELELLMGVRGTLATVLENVPYAIRNTLLYFFVLFSLKVVLKREWLAVAVFTVFFAVLSALDSDKTWLGVVIGFLYFGVGAWVMTRGLFAFTVGAFVSNVLSDVVATRDTSAWFFSNSLLILAIVLGIAVFGFMRATARGKSVG